MIDAVTAKADVRARGLQMKSRVAQAGIRLLSLASIVLFAAACGVYEGGETVVANPNDVAFAATSGISEEDQIAAFEETLFPVMRDYTCEECHFSGSNLAPFSLADPNSTTAFRAIVDNNRVNFGSPGQSRLVARLASDNHHCWSDCNLDASEMLSAIQAWVAQMDSMSGGLEGGVDVGAETLSSDTLTQFDGETDEGGERYTRNLIAFWKFDEFDPAGSPGIARDTSGVTPAIDLVLDGDVSFMQSYGLDIADGRAVASSDQSRKLYEEIANPVGGTGQYSIEAWVVPANTTQEGPARIVTYSRNRGSRNFLLGQQLYQYVARNRNEGGGTNNNGNPALETYDVDEDLQAALQHVVMTYDRANGRRIYVDGVFTDDYDEIPTGPLWNWDSNHRLVLGRELSDENDTQWIGQIRMLAIYRESLEPDEIKKNYTAGVGLRVKMTFDVSRWAGDGAVIEMSRLQIDDNSYLFCQPTLVSESPGIRLQNMRVVVNGVEASAGQAFTNVSTIVTSGRQELSRRCAIVENPSGDDTFQLVFEVLGPYVDPVDSVAYDPITYDYSGAVSVPLHGVRDFGRVNETMLELTGIPAFSDSIATRVGDANNETVQDVYDGLHQQLPDSYDVRSFVSSHQVAITKLALEYCSALVFDDASRDVFFDRTPAFDFDATPSVAFIDMTPITGPLIEKMINPDDANQPAALAMETRLEMLIGDLRVGCGDGVDCNTREIVSGACAATLASATMAMH